MRKNVEIKARCEDTSRIREILKSRDAVFKGTDYQVDTYFKTKSGRLKLREGKIENCLVWYEREDKKGPKKSNVVLFETGTSPCLKDILTRSLEVLVVVDKLREIWFIDNVKFHLDIVKNLGNFVEIEATDEKGIIKKERLFSQCEYFLRLFRIRGGDLVPCSYSDLLLRKGFNYK
jgi:adenylate cyclase class IV